MVTPEAARRTFQIVVAATKQWGIGKGALQRWETIHLPHTCPRRLTIPPLSPTQAARCRGTSPAT